MALLDKTFPTLDCSACILTPKMTEASRHPKIKLISYAEIENISGHIGNYEVTILKNQGTWMRTSARDAVSVQRYALLKW